MQWRRGGRSGGLKARAGGLVCERDGNPTSLRCAKCGRPICPRCLVQTPVGFTCDGHGGKPVYHADDLPLTPRDRPLRPPEPSPPIMPLLLMLGAPLLIFVMRMAGAGGSTGAGFVFALPGIALSAWFILRRARRR